MGVIIAFWSPLHGRGNTSAAIATAMQMAMKYNVMEYITHSHFARSTMESAFLTSDDDGDMLKFSDLGLDSLSRSVRTRCITNDDVKSYCNKINDNLYFISGSRKSHKELFDTNVGQDFIDICNFIKEGDNVTFIDVDSGYNNKVANEIIEVADYVVVTLDQTNMHCKEYFEELNMIPEEKEIIILGRYDYMSKYSKNYVSKKYKREVFTLPNDSDFLDATNNHKVNKYFESINKSNVENMLLDEVNLLVDNLADKIQAAGVSIEAKEEEHKKRFSLFKR